jgi:hypothetical protein
MADGVEDTWKLQQSYAWDWFKFHADQRTKLFNYLLVAEGIFANGLVNALKERDTLAIGLISAVGMMIAIAFERLDVRNRYLVNIGKNALVGIENTKLFPPAPESDLQKACLEPDKRCAILARQTEEDGRIHCAFQGLWNGQHRLILPLVAGIIALFFFVMLVFAICAPNLIESAAQSAGK